MKIKKILKNNYLLIISLLIIIFLFLCAIWPNIFTPYGNKEVFTKYLGVSSSHIFGTNDLGYDTFTEVLYGTRNTLLVGVLSSLIAIILGSLIGIIAGYFNILGEVFNGGLIIFLLLPTLPLGLVLGAFFKNNIFALILIVGLLSFSSSAKIIRNETLSLKESDMIKHLVSLGYTKSRIIFFHIIPNLKDVIIARYLILIPRCILLEATLSFLGLGDITNPTWGSMISIAYKQGAFTLGRLNLLLGPTLFIFLSTISAHLLSAYFRKRSKAVHGITTD